MHILTTYLLLCRLDATVTLCILLFKCSTLISSRGIIPFPPGSVLLQVKQRFVDIGGFTGVVSENDSTMHIPSYSWKYRNLL